MAFKFLLRLTLVTIAWGCLEASEHRGTVQAVGLPIPGATVTATQGDTKLLTTTDDRGAYSFPNLADGVWTIQVEMLGFTKMSREVGVEPDAPEATWELKLLPLEAIRQQLAPAKTPAPAGATTPAPAKPAAGPPASQAAAKPAAPGTGSGRGNWTGNGANGRPSIRGANGQGGFQRLGLNQTGEATDGAGNGDMAAAAAADANQSSDAFVVNGSVSNGLNMPQQNDWMAFGGRGAMDILGLPAAPGMGGPQMGGPQMAGGRGPMGGGGFGGGGFGGRGGFGGAGGPGGRGMAGRGGRGPQASFGNARRDRRQQYNGNINFSLDNSALDARPFSLTGQNTPQAAYSKARASMMFGGPLKIPHVLSGKNTYFNINYQFARNRNGSVYTGLMPTGDERNGDFANALDPLTGRPVTVYDPTTGAPFANNTIPQNRLSQSAQVLMGYYPLPNFVSDARYNYQIPLVGVMDQDNVNTRLNHTFNWRNQINGGIGYQRSHTSTPNGFGFTDTTAMTGINANAAYIFHVTQRTIETLRYNFSRSSTRRTPFFAGVTNVSAAAGIFGNNQDPLNWGPPGLSFNGGFSGLSDGQESVTRNQTSALGDTVLWIHGTHNFTFGGDFRRQQFNPLSQQNPRGSFTFTGGLTSQYTNDVAVSGTGFDLADFLLGYPDTFSLATGNADKYFRTSWYDLYFTDDWRVSTRLSLNAGLRWDYAAPVTELYGRLVNLDISGFYAAATPICGAAIGSCPAGAGPLSGQSYGASLLRPDKTNFAPRVGFAWRPFAKHSTVVRGGYGIYYNTSVYSGIANQMAQQAPLSKTLNLANTLANPLTLGNALLATPNALTNTFAIDPNFRIGYAQVWQFSVQQNLVAGMVVTGTYIGTKGTRNPQQFLPNSTPPGYVGPALGPAGFVYESSGGDSTYAAGQIQLQRRFRAGFSGNLMYTYSHAIDDAVALGGQAQPGTTAVAQNWLDLAAERANSTFDQRHRLTLSMQYSTGQGTAGGTLLRGWKGGVLKDWTFVTNLTVGSGLPETPVALTNRSVAGGTGFVGTVRPDLTGAAIGDAPAGLAYNPAAFLAPLAGTWGTAGRDSLAGPSQFSFGGSAGRVFRIDEKRSFDLRFDANNLLNHVVYSSYNSTFGSQQFGLPASAAAMRTFTANLRFRF